MTEMTILVIDDDSDALKELCDKLKEFFPQEKIAPFREPLPALQYASDHPKEIALVFCAMVMWRLDGLELSQSLRKHSPGAVIFFTVQTESWELEAIARQHGNGTCLIKPVTVEAIREAVSFLDEPCLMEDEFCREECAGKWCERLKCQPDQSRITY